MPPKQGSEFDNKQRGGSTRWTGKGPKPARHIPWPEVFKHHISVVEGHQRMIDMIRKHTVEGTSNNHTIVACLERANQMLKDTKDATRAFIPPNDRDQVPIGSASDSMYVGYSPADHAYGDAAEEFGRQAALAKQRGEDITTATGVDYEPGQSHGLKNKSLRELRGLQTQQPPARPPPRFASGANGDPVAQKERVASEPAADGETNQYFFVDTNPTPAAATTNGKSAKRGTDAHERPAKKPKRSQEPEIEKQDISAEVDARLAEKEKERKEKKEGKKNTKRKRESDTALPAEEATAEHEDKMDVDESEKAEKPKKKKAKRSKDEDATREVEEEAEAEKPKRSKRSKTEDAEAEEPGVEKLKKKKSKKSKDDAEEDEAKPKKAKKSKKDKA